MKRILALLILSSITRLSFAQPLEEKDLIVELGMGYPNLSYLRTNFDNLIHFSGLSNNIKNENKSIGQFIVNSEYMLTDKLGFALGINYGYYNNYSEESITIFNGNTNTSETKVYFYNQKIHRIRVYLGPTFHVLRTENLDSYIGIKVGIKKSIFDQSSNNPDVNFGNNFELPVGFRLSWGFRIFLNEYWAIHAKVGLGGPAISFGLTYKLTE